MTTSVRIDKWLWAVRIYKTRNQATLACRGGKIKQDGRSVKPSREVKPGDMYAIQTGPIQKTVKVLAILEKRVAAKLAPEYVEDLTPAEEIKKLKVIRESYFISRKKGSGRPTKKERRELDQFDDEVI